MTNETLDTILKGSTFEILKEKLVYARLKDFPPSASKCFMVSQDKDEVTIVVSEDKLNGFKIIEKNKEIWKAIALNVSIPFYSVGFLAKISEKIAEQNINILMISTFSKDYVLVKEEDLKKTIGEIKKLGLKEQIQTPYENVSKAGLS